MPKGLRKYQIIVKQQKTDLTLETHEELSYTKKMLIAKWRAKTMFRKPKVTVTIKRLIRPIGIQATMFL